ncbi:MAG: CidA/LrgA family protein [Oscillospiraceae bacterium]|nr:CidA/LrgA family protein [Oscillospiraceae bacterium]
MKYLRQAENIAAVTFVAEAIRYLVPLPIPASIYGLVLLFTLLKTGAVKLSQIEDVGGLLLELMPLLLVPASVSVLTVLDTIQGMLLPVLIMGFIGTIVVMLVTGKISQWVVRRKEASHE